MSETLNIDEIKEKFYNKLQDSGWARVLRGFIFSTEFEKIISNRSCSINNCSF
jgi:hypothetical protein